MEKIEIGDYITFKAPTRSHYKRARRRVNGFYGSEQHPTVGYHGWSNFVVYPHEISEVEKTPSRQAASPPA